MEPLHTRLKRYCLSLTGSTWDADDLAQDTWEKAVRSQRPSGESSRQAWLMRIARNRWVDVKRREAAFARIMRREAPAAEVSMPDGGPMELEMVFQALMKHLSPLQRAVFLLRDVFGFSAQETAEWLDTTEGAAKAALHRARQSLRGVRRELEQGGLPRPQEEGVKALLRVLAQSFARGDIAVLVELVQRDELDAAAVLGSVAGTAQERSRSVSSGRSRSETKLAA